VRYGNRYATLPFQYRKEKRHAARNAKPEQDSPFATVIRHRERMSVVRYRGRDNDGSGPCTASTVRSPAWRGSSSAPSSGSRSAGSCRASPSPTWSSSPAMRACTATSPASSTTCSASSSTSPTSARSTPSTSSASSSVRRHERCAHEPVHQVRRLPPAHGAGAQEDLQRCQPVQLFCSCNTCTR
jgi:hypothetical protein